MGKKEQSDQLLPEDISPDLPLLGKRAASGHVQLEDESIIERVDKIIGDLVCDPQGAF